MGSERRRAKKFHEVEGIPLMAAMDERLLTRALARKSFTFPSIIDESMSIVRLSHSIGGGTLSTMDEIYAGA